MLFEMDEDGIDHTDPGRLITVPDQTVRKADPEHCGFVLNYIAARCPHAEVTRKQSSEAE